MKRADVIALARVAGYHADHTAVTSLLVENRISRASVEAAFAAGAASNRSGVACTCFECREAVPPVLVLYRRIAHAAHYMYDHPGRGHDLEEWTIEAPVRPSWDRLRELGLPSDAKWDAGHVFGGQQRWTYSAKRELSAGTCERCR